MLHNNILGSHDQVAMYLCPEDLANALASYIPIFIMESAKPAQYTVVL